MNDQDIGWSGNASKLFKMFDQQRNGYLTLEALDPEAARMLASACGFNSMGGRIDLGQEGWQNFGEREVSAV